MQRIIILLACALGCGQPAERTARIAADSARADSLARARQDSINRTLPGYVVDSIFPTEEALRRFRSSVGGTPVTRLAGGSTSREELVARFVTAFSAADTATLRAMVVTSREFADLYYPDSPWSHPPYQQQPALAWSMIQSPSREGLTVLLRRLGGQRLEYVSHACDSRPEREGRTLRHANCVVTTRDAGGGTATGRLFGSIIERDGQFKILSYTNRF